MDLAILYAIQHIRTEFLDRLMIFFTHLGQDSTIWILQSVVLLFFKKTRKCGILMLLSMYIAHLIGDEWLKPMIARTRPCWVHFRVKMVVPIPSSYSFPSGHALQSFTCATVIFLHHKKSGIAAFILAGLIAFSRVYLFVHYPTDVLGGMLIGALIAVVLLLLSNVAIRLFTRIYGRIQNKGKN